MLKRSKIYRENTYKLIKKANSWSDIVKVVGFFFVFVLTNAAVNRGKNIYIFLGVHILLIAFHVHNSLILCFLFVFLWLWYQISSEIIELNKTFAEGRRA